MISYLSLRNPSNARETSSIACQYSYSRYNCAIRVIIKILRIMARYVRILKRSSFMRATLCLICSNLASSILIPMISYLSLKRKKPVIEETMLNTQIIPIQLVIDMSLLAVYLNPPNILPILPKPKYIFPSIGCCITNTIKVNYYNE